MMLRARGHGHGSGHHGGRITDGGGTLRPSSGHIPCPSRDVSMAAALASQPRNCPTMRSSSPREGRTKAPFVVSLCITAPVRPQRDIRMTRAAGSGSKGWSAPVRDLTGCRRPLDVAAIGRSRRPPGFAPPAVFATLTEKTSIRPLASSTRRTGCCGAYRLLRGCQAEVTLRFPSPFQHAHQHLQAAVAEVFQTRQVHDH
jgi:hypothetical protein